jgi:hypothetical protein
MIFRFLIGIRAYTGAEALFPFSGLNAGPSARCACSGQALKARSSTVARKSIVICNSQECFAGLSAFPQQVQAFVSMTFPKWLIRELRTTRDAAGGDVEERPFMAAFSAHKNNRPLGPVFRFGIICVWM